MLVGCACHCTAWTCAYVTITGIRTMEGLAGLCTLSRLLQSRIPRRSFGGNLSPRISCAYYMYPSLTKSQRGLIEFVLEGTFLCDRHSVFLLFGLNSKWAELSTKSQPTHQLCQVTTIDACQDNSTPTLQES